MREWVVNRSNGKVHRLWNRKRHGGCNIGRMKSRQVVGSIEVARDVAGPKFHECLRCKGSDIEA